MGFWKARIFQNSLFKQAKYFVSSPQKAYKYLLVNETGEIGIGVLPMTTGFVVSHESQRVWRMISYLACTVKGVEGRMLPIGERSYIPLDPFNKLSDDDKKKLAQDSELSDDKKTIKLSEIDSIASREHDKALANLRNSEAKRQAAAMFKTAMIVCGIILITIIIWYMIKK